MNNVIVKAIQLLAEYETEQRMKANDWANMGSHVSEPIRSPVAQAANSRADAIMAVIAELGALKA